MSSSPSDFPGFSRTSPSRSNGSNVRFSPDSQDHLHPRDPVGAFSGNQVSDNVDGTPGAGAFVGARPCVGEIAEPRVERRGRAREKRERVLQRMLHRDILDSLAWRFDVGIHKFRKRRRGERVGLRHGHTRAARRSRSNGRAAGDAGRAAPGDSRTVTAAAAPPRARGQVVDRPDPPAPGRRRGRLGVAHAIDPRAGSGAVDGLRPGSLGGAAALRRGGSVGGDRDVHRASALESSADRARDRRPT